MNPMSTDPVFEKFASSFESQKQTEMTLKEYLEGCRDNPSYYASAAERMMTAIGEPARIDTSQDSRLGRIFMNRTILV